MLSSATQDLTFALCQFRRSPGFAGAVVITLALGIGATTAIFSLVDGILLRPLPFPDADRLVAIDTLEFPAGVTGTNPAAANSIGTSYPNFFDWQRQNHTFEALASCDLTPRLFSKMNGEGARVIPAARVSANLFSTLGVVPALGRTFTPEDEHGGHRVVILSHELWVSDFASAPNVVGQTVKISNEVSTIAGVMPPGFHYPIDEPASFWATYAADNEGHTPNTSLRGWDRLSIVGRLKVGAGTKQALADLNTIQLGLARHYSEDRYRLGVSVTPLLDEAVSDVRPVLSLLFAAVGVVLLIGCANVAGLLLVRANGRRPEVAVRTALGASRARVVRQLLSEALLLALAGGVAGILMSGALLRIGLRYIPSDLPRLYNIGVDGRVLAFAVLLSVGTALSFGLAPAWRMSRLDPANALRECGLSATSGRRRNRLHHALVVAETGLGFTLLIGSGLLIRSLINRLVIEPGFDTKHTVAFDIALTNARYPDPSKVLFFDKLLPELAALPGVERVSSGHPLPLYGWSSSWANLTILGHSDSPDNLPGAIAAVAGPGYFETLSIPLLRGRTFTEQDNSQKSAPKAVTNQSFARKFFPGEDPIGHYFVPHDEGPHVDHAGEPAIASEIIGIVGDTRTRDVWNPYQPEFYLPYAQDPTHQRPLVVMKVSGDPLSYANAVRRVVSNVDQEAPVFRYRTFTDDIEMQNAQPRFEAALVSGFAGIAVLLSALGLYAVLSYIVAERLRELGLRMALGASRTDILQLVLRRALILACLGIGVGALASIFATRFIAVALFKVEPLDRLVFLIVTLVLLSVSMMAGLAPALRAANVDPMRTLREQ
jgi:putative ABC transport system permease protein